MTNIEWLHAICPYCLEKYSYVEAYKPATCGRFECVYKHLHKRAVDSQEYRLRKLEEERR